MARTTRRTRFGLPDVFLQEPKQREVSILFPGENTHTQHCSIFFVQDELTAETVKNGFTFKPVEGLSEVRKSLDILST